MPLRRVILCGSGTTRASVDLKNVKSLGNKKENTSVSSISRREWGFFFLVAYFSLLVQLCLQIRIGLKLRPFGTVKPRRWQEIYLNRKDTCKAQVGRHGLSVKV